MASQAEISAMEEALRLLDEQEVEDWEIGPGNDGKGLKAENENMLIMVLDDISIKKTLEEVPERMFKRTAIRKSLGGEIKYNKERMLVIEINGLRMYARTKDGRTQVVITRCNLEL